MSERKSNGEKLKIRTVQERTERTIGGRGHPKSFFYSWSSQTFVYSLSSSLPSKPITFAWDSPSLGLSAFPNHPSVAGALSFMHRHITMAVCFFNGHTWFVCICVCRTIASFQCLFALYSSIPANTKNDRSATRFRTIFGYLL